ncbi:MAG TPA: AAA family ATPase, partial [Rhodospirillaceae bacterium]|nr:AAA family ATPase [Rhodospirillaceae bacterium]
MTGKFAAGLARQRLSVTRLTLSDFRCYAFLRLDVEPTPVVLTGPNGAGKTNILEALSFLAPGRGLRRAKLSEAVRRQSGPEAPWAVAARIERPDGVQELGIGREAGTERRLLRLDGRPMRSQSALASVLSVLWLTPAMDRLFSESPGGRRRFLDRLVLGLDPTHGPRAAAYEHSLRERARLLRAGQFDPAWLGVLEDSMARQGVAMAMARKDCVERLNQACAMGIGPFPAARLAVEGGVEISLDSLDA